MKKKSQNQTLKNLPYFLMSLHSLALSYNNPKYLDRNLA